MTLLDLRADHHTYSLFSAGAGTIDANVRAAERRGLARLVITDAVAGDTDWLPAYRKAVQRASARTDVRVACGVEAQILDTSGALDLPADLTGVEYISVAERGFPLRAGPSTVADVRMQLSTGVLTPDVALELLVKASVRAVVKAAEVAQPVLARPFRVLSQVGIGEDRVTDDLLAWLAEGCLSAGAAVEVNERLGCPSVRVALALSAAGVPLVAASGARHPDEVGRWEYLCQVEHALESALPAN